MMERPATNQNRSVSMHQERGFSLLEVLIAATVLAVALLGIGLLATRAVYDAASLRDHTLADLLISDLRARAELLGSSPLATAPGSAGVAGAEFRDWQALVSTLLPAAESDLCRHGSLAPPDWPAVACDGTGPLLVRLAWRRKASGAVESRQEAMQP